MKKLMITWIVSLWLTSISLNAATLQVYAAANQPTLSLAFEGATRVGFTRVFLRNLGSVPIKAMLKVQQNVLEDWVFRSVVLLDDDYIQIGTSRVLDENRQAVIGESLEILPGTSKSVIVAGNMDGDLKASAGRQVRLDVIGVETDAIVDALQVPITDGTAHVISASLRIGTLTAYLSVFDPMKSETVKPGTKGRRFSGVRVIAGSAERIRLRSVVFTQEISRENGVTPAKISNAEVVVDGVHYPVEIKRNIDVVHYPLPVRRDRYTAQFGQGVVVEKGFSKDIYIQGDLDDSTETRLLKMDIFSDLDVHATGELYGYGVSVYASNVSIGRSDYSSRFPQGGAPWFSGSLLTVEANMFPARLDRLEPATPRAGDNVTLHGTGFSGDNHFYIRYPEGGVGGGLFKALRAGSADGKTLRFQIPLDVSSGRYRLLVNNGVVWPSNELFFDVIPTPVSVGVGGGGTVIVPSTEPKPPSDLPGTEINILQDKGVYYRQFELPGGKFWGCFALLSSPLPENVVVWWDSEWSGQYPVPTVFVNGEGTHIGFQLSRSISHLPPERLQEIGRVRIFELPDP